MAIGAKRLIPRCMGARVLLPGALSLFLCLSIGVCQDQPRNNSAAPKYDLKAETKLNGTLEEVKLLDFATRKDFVQLVVKSGDIKVVVYVCPKPFQDEMGVTFSKGDAITITGAKVKQEEADVILARELVKGQDTLLFRDDKGNPVWDPRTGK
jgi:hypothetical protein